MIARNDVKRPYELNLDPRPLLAAVQLQLAARVDAFVARWLARCAADIDAAQHVVDADRKPAREFDLT